MAREMPLPNAWGTVDFVKIALISDDVRAHDAGGFGKGSHFEELVPSLHQFSTRTLSLNAKHHDGFF
jgi:hypothetical protein